MRHWSTPAAVFAVRAAVLVPAVFAFALVVQRSPQVAMYAATGGICSLITASFGGSRRDRAVAHLMLTSAGSLLIALGTLVSPSVVAAAVATALVAFTSFFAAVIGPKRLGRVRGVAALPAGRFRVRPGARHRPTGRGLGARDRDRWAGGGAHGPTLGR